MYGINVSQVQANDATALHYINQIPSSSIPWPACTAYLPLFICNMLHPACDNTTADPTPVLPCASMCTGLYNACPSPVISYLQTNPSFSPYLDCTNATIYDQGASPCSTLTNPTPIPCNNAQNETKPLIYPGACQPFDIAAAQNSGEACAPFVSKMIYVPSDAPGIQAFEDSRANITIANVKAARVIVPLKCYKSMAAVLCPIIFPTCITVDIPQYKTIAAVPELVCQSYCLDASDECAPLFEYLNVTEYLPKCHQANLYASTDVYLWNVSDVQVAVKCRDFMFPLDPYAEFTLPDIACPLQTGKKLHPTDEDPMCGLQCPDSSYSVDEWQVLVKLTQAGSSLSLICMLFLLVSYLVTSSKRRFPSSTHISEFIATAMFSVSFLIGGRHPEKDVWCVDEGTNATLQNNATCGVQGFFFIFFGLALAAWCCIISFIMFYAIVLTKTKSAISNLQRFDVLFYILGWGLPLIFAIAAAASHKIGYGPPLAWCFIHFEGFGEGSGLSSDYPLFYIPMGVLFVAILTMFWVTVAILLLYRNKSSENSIFVTAQVRVLIFIFVIFAICFTIFEWRFQIEGENRKGNLAQVGLNWAYCKIKFQMKISDNMDECPGDINPARYFHF
eukprot:Phypoly_transcript_03268.p1 GENE.Phypoly_transcript_03268~~Phypoly_transcript_03268.p1  ORF type:complete len:618 (+),score=53.14 Phypoly_transcript_03268:122-1975(+)